MSYIRKPVERNFKCIYKGGCGKAFKSRADLTRHTRMHTGERPFKCSYDGCQYAFTQMGTLKVHVRTHTGEKPFKCTVEGCGSAFTQSNTLTKHLITHTGEKPYPCLVEGCGKRYTEAGSLKKHNRCHTGETPYRCEICGNSFTHASTLGSHMRTHSTLKPFGCTFDGCNARSNDKGAMQRHIKTHSGERPFKCTVKGCGSVYTRQSSLDRHLMVHSGRKPHKCRMHGCERAFVDAAGLNKHVSDKHPKYALKKFRCSQKGCFVSVDTAEELLRHHAVAHPIVSTPGLMTFGSHTKKAFPPYADPEPFPYEEISAFKPAFTKKKRQGGYKCEFEGCGMDFSVPSKLAKHMWTHTGEVLPVKKEPATAHRSISEDEEDSEHEDGQDMKVQVFPVRQNPESTKRSPRKSTVVSYKDKDEDKDRDEEGRREEPFSASKFTGSLSYRGKKRAASLFSSFTSSTYTGEKTAISLVSSSHSSPSSPSSPFSTNKTAKAVPSTSKRQREPATKQPKAAQPIKQRKISQPGTTGGKNLSSKAPEKLSLSERRARIEELEKALAERLKRKARKAANAARNQDQEMDVQSYPKAQPERVIFQVDDRVEGNFQGRGRYFPGFISAVGKKETFTINYDDGDVEFEVPAGRISKQHSSAAKKTGIEAVSKAAEENEVKDNKDQRRGIEDNVTNIIWSPEEALLKDAADAMLHLLGSSSMKLVAKS